MIAQRLLVATAFCASCLASAPARSSDLTFTFMDFEFIDSDVAASGTQSPVPEQTVSVSSGNGDGISVAGSLAVADRFFLRGRFESSIVDVTGVVTSPLASTDVGGDYDLVRSNLSFGYRRDIGENADLLLYAGLDSTSYDFGSFAGENFDVEESGVGLGLGVRFNPVPALELHATAHFSSVGEADLDGLELESDTGVRAGLMWYFFEDLGLGLDYESGAADAVTISMRFGFGDLAW